MCVYSIFVVEKYEIVNKIRATFGQINEIEKKVRLERQSSIRLSNHCQLKISRVRTWLWYTKTKVLNNIVDIKEIKNLKKYYSRIKKTHPLSWQILNNSINSVQKLYRLCSEATIETKTKACELKKNDLKQVTVVS